MYLDLQMAIAENDAVKVSRAAKLAGIQAAFPYLDRKLIEFTGRLPARDKLRGLEKRYLFKRATRDLLPKEIRNKRKHGFGVPISVWLRRGGCYHDLMRDVILSPRAKARSYFDHSYIERIFDEHSRGAWDHSAGIHSLGMLELWHREYVDGRS
jgi:asparagine synthase (glutamine-hydrolysing)